MSAQTSLTKADERFYKFSVFISPFAVIEFVGNILILNLEQSFHCFNSYFN